MHTHALKLLFLQYNGEPMTNFCVMSCAIASGKAKLSGINADCFAAFTTGVCSASLLHFWQAYV